MILVGGCDYLSIAVIDFKLRRRDFRMVFLILEAHGALHFRCGVNESAQRVSRQRVIVAACVYVLEFAGFMITALGVCAFEEETLNLIGGVKRVPLGFI